MKSYVIHGLLMFIWSLGPIHPPPACLILEILACDAARSALALLLMGPSEYSDRYSPVKELGDCQTSKSVIFMSSELDARLSHQSQCKHPKPIPSGSSQPPSLNSKPLSPNALHPQKPQWRTLNAAGLLMVFPAEDPAIEMTRWMHASTLGSVILSCGCLGLTNKLKNLRTLPRVYGPHMLLGP